MNYQNELTLTQRLMSWNSIDRVRQLSREAQNLWEQVPSFVIVDGQAFIHMPSRGDGEIFVYEHRDVLKSFRKPEINKIWMGMMETIDLSRRILHARHSGYECSTKGDIRFSAFNARLEDGRTIEMHYQCDVKGYDVGGNDWKLGKGRPPKVGLSRDELWLAYYRLWTTWCADRKHWMHELHYLAAQNDYTLADIFSGGVINQARALSQFINDHPWDGHGNIVGE